MKQITIYKYDELPTEEAKKVARDWWASAEIECPGWQSEHFASMESAIDAISHDVSKEELIKQSEALAWTGYCADSLLADLIKKNDCVPDKEELSRYYQEAWDYELYERCSDTEYIEESIVANNYEFLESGRIYY